MSALVVHAAPATEPLTLAEVEANLRLDTSDPLLTALIVTAREEAERRANCALITQTIDLYLDRFPCWELELVRGPLQSVTDITYLDANGVTQLLAADQYQVDAHHERGRLTPAFGAVWPATREQMNAVKVRYVAGYGTAANVPAAIKQWMHLAVATWYAQREAIIAGAVSELPTEFFAGLLGSAQVRRFF